MNLREKRAAALEKARSIAMSCKNADGSYRAYTSDERVETDRLLAEVDDLDRQLDLAEKDETKMKRLGALRDDQGANAGDLPQVKSVIWAKAVADRLQKSAMMAGAEGQKSLISGSIEVENILDPTILRLPQQPTSFLDLLPVRNVAGSNVFSSLRQTVRTNNAAPVADLALKPTSIYTMAEVTDRFRVIAHLSEAVPQRYFSDYTSLLDFLRSEMIYGLSQKLEQQVASGDGTGENLTGLLNTSGILTVAYSTSLLATIRKALTNLQTASSTTPNAIVLHPTNAEQFDLLQDTTGQFLLGGPGQAPGGSLWSIPRVVSSSVPLNTALIGDFNAASLMQREAATAAIDVGGDNFTHNTAVLRLEGRYGLSVNRPTAFAKVALA